MGGDTASRPHATAASMLSRRAAHPSSALRVPAAARARNSAQRPTAAAVHCNDVCCGLNFTTSAVAPQRAHSTGCGAA